MVSVIRHDDFTLYFRELDITLIVCTSILCVNYINNWFGYITVCEHTVCTSYWIGWFRNMINCTFVIKFVQVWLKNLRLKYICLTHNCFGHNWFGYINDLNTKVEPPKLKYTELTSDKELTTMFIRCDKDVPQGLKILMKKIN